MGTGVGLALSGLLGAGGSIAGGLLGQQSNSSADLRIPTSDPSTNLAQAASSFSALQPLGFGDIRTIPTPYQRLVDRVNSLPIEEKTKRRGLRSLQEYFSGQPVSYPVYLKSILGRTGISESDLPLLVRQNQQFTEQQQMMGGTGFDPETIRNRANASNTANTLISQAANAAQGGGMSELNRGFLDRINRQIADQRETALLQGRLGAFNPSIQLENLDDASLDAEFRAIEQSLLTAGNINAALSAGTQVAQTSAGQQAQAQANSLSIASQQAQAANQLNAQIASNNSTSMANGVSGGIAALGNAATLGAVLGATAPAAPVGATAPAATTRSSSFDTYQPSFDLNAPTLKLGGR